MTVCIIHVVFYVIRTQLLTLLLSPLSCTCVLRILRSADDLFWASSCSMVCWIPEKIKKKNIYIQLKKTISVG